MKFPALARVGLAVVCGVVVPLLLEPASLVISPNQESEPNNTPATATPLNLTSRCVVPPGPNLMHGRPDFGRESAVTREGRSRLE